MEMAFTVVEKASESMYFEMEKLDVHVLMDFESITLNQHFAFYRHLRTVEHFAPTRKQLIFWQTWSTVRTTQPHLKANANLQFR